MAKDEKNQYLKFLSTIEEDVIKNYLKSFYDDKVKRHTFSFYDIGTRKEIKNFPETGEVVINEVLKSFRSEEEYITKHRQKFTDLIDFGLKGMFFSL